MSHNVFVYGTLRPGHGNHRRLLSKAVHIGTGVTHPSDTFNMFLSHLGGGIPFVVRRSVEENLHTPVSDIIAGDLFQVTDRELFRLDALEGHPHWYCREEVNVKVKVGDGYINQTAWMYLLPKHRLDSNIQNITGDFNNIQTYSDNSNVTLNVGR
jgi:gamma-glutamylcyclotransferase (GGCT)/AIG2-like uncharacterized protein YtfP